MKNLTLIFIGLFFANLSLLGQTKRKTTFKVLVGENVIARTNFRNEIYLSSPSTEYHEKATLGLSFQLLSSFYLSDKWKLNTGVIMDKKGYQIKVSGLLASSTGGIFDTSEYKLKKTADYLGIPLSLERIILQKRKFKLSFDIGIAEQWKISNDGNGASLLPNQFTFLGGIDLVVHYEHISFIAHPIIRYSPTQLESSLIGGPSPSFNAYSVGLELGISF